MNPYDHIVNQLVRQVGEANLQSQAKINEFREGEAANDALAAMHKRQAAEVELECAQIKKTNYRNHSRPSIALQADLVRDGNGWAAVKGELHVYGDTPEQAFDNFDHAWIQGT